MTKGEHRKKLEIKYSTQAGIKATPADIIAIRKRAAKEAGE